MNVFTKAIDTKNFKAVPGMAVPRKYDKPHVIRHLREKYGKDAVIAIGQDNLDVLTAMLGGESAEKSLASMKQMSVEQAQKIKALEKENAALRKQVQRLEGPQQ